MTEQSNVEKRLALLEQRLEATESANAVLEGRNRELREELTKLRPPVPREQALHRVLDGQGPVPLDRGGNRVITQAEPSMTTVGACSSFGKVYEVDSDGRRILVADGLRRDSSGLVITPVLSNASIPMGPSRSHSHQQSIEMLDRMFPITPMTMDD